MWESIASFIRESQSFLITTHTDPEGDAIGSEMALKEFLGSLGKQVYIVNSSPTPKNCEFLDPNEEILVYPDSYHPDILEKIDGLFILDVNNWRHLGKFSEKIRKSSKPRMCIDHHQEPKSDFADIIVNDTSAAAAGVLIYELIRYMGGKITKKIAEALYAALITDTGTFHFTNTDARVFHIAADLYGRGADPFLIYRDIFANKSWGAGRLLGPVLSTIESAADGQIAWIHVTQDMFKNASAIYEDSDSILELVRNIKDVELGIFFKETEGGSIKVSIRSNGTVDAYRIAKQLGGGGHKMASGVNVEGPMERAIKEVIGKCLDAPELRN